MTDAKLIADVFLHYNGSASYASLDTASTHSNTFLLSGYSKSRSSKAISISAAAAAAAAADAIPSGPYFASITGKQVSIFEAWRLYSDTERACKSRPAI
jgi:hypothetical protein